MGIKGQVQENPPADASVFVEKRNHCFIFPPKVAMVAHSVERRNNHWFVQTNASSDLTVQIENKSFHLHRIPMASRSGYINRLAFQTNGSDSNNIQMDSIPGGAKIFELVVRFCYGLKINATATNIAPLYCAAHFLEMSDDLAPGNLISKAESFLSFIILSSWKDTFRVLRSCESVSTWAKDLQIVKQCSESISWKACSGTNTNSFITYDVFLNVLGKTNTDDMASENLPENWWFEDASTLRIDHFIELVSSIKKRRKINPEVVGSCIAHWTKKWLPRIRIGNKENQNDDDIDLTIKLQIVTLECLIRILPSEENSVSCNFLLQLFKIGQGMKINPELLNQVKTRIAMMLERCKAKDLLVKNTTSLFDVEIVVQVVQAYVEMTSEKHHIAKLVYEYMVLVAGDENLPAKTFRMLVHVLPKEACHCEDNLYSAIDMYLKAHPSLTEEERTEICRVLEYHKLSQEARTHVTRNHRLPESMMTRFILLEQVSMARSAAFRCSGHERTKQASAVLRIGKELKRSHNKDVKVMKKDVEMLKLQIGKLQMCRMELQRQIKKPIVI